MKNTTRTYVLTVNARQGLRLWTGAHIHALRRCSIKQAGLALTDIQRSLNDLQASAQSPDGLHPHTRAR